MCREVEGFKLVTLITRVDNADRMDFRFAIPRATSLDITSKYFYSTRWVS